MQKGDSSMADVKVISVNPGKNTIGALNFEFIEKVARTCRPVGKVIHNQRVKSICNSIFGINKSTTNVGSAKLLLIRAIIAAFFMTLGILNLDITFLSAEFNIHLFNIVIGGMILLGFFARIASICGFILYAFMAAGPLLGVSSSSISLYSSTPVITAISQSLIFLFLAITGPGRYCIDQLLRNWIFRIAKHKAAKRAKRKNLREAEVRMSYKAWKSLNDI